jgi:nucleoside recognition membrane protein YjiH
MSEDPKKSSLVEELKVPWYGYLALIVAIVFFSGLLAKQQGWITFLDFNTINGKFGVMKDAAKATFMGQGGTGVRAGFLFAFGLVPAVMLALGVVEIIDHLGGLKAGQKLLTPILRPVLGIPGIAGLALVTSLQSTDAGAGMTKMLRESGFMDEKEKTVFCAFQFSAGGTITNYLSSGAALFGFLTVPIILPLVVIFVMKIFGANVMRFYLNRVVKEV